MNTFTFYTYILECSDKTLYTGYTNNIEKRLYEHNNTGNGARYTRSRRPVKLAYSESYSTQSDAMKREVKIKRLSRAKKLMLIENGTVSDS